MVADSETLLLFLLADSLVAFKVDGAGENRNKSIERLKKKGKYKAEYDL